MFSCQLASTINQGCVGEVIVSLCVRVHACVSYVKVLGVLVGVCFVSDGIVLFSIFHVFLDLNITFN